MYSKVRRSNHYTRDIIEGYDDGRRYIYFFNHSTEV